MELPNRNQFETDFAAELSQMTSAQRSRLRQYLGEPPRPSRVPASFWDEVRREYQQRVAATLYLITLAAAEWHVDDDVPQDVHARLDARANAYATAAAGRRADDWAERMRYRFDELDRLLREFERTGNEMSDEQLEEELGKVLNPDDAAREAATSTTEAQTAGGDAGAAETFQLSALDTWINQPHLSRTGPCQRCEALHGKKRSEWAAIDTAAVGGPPIHDYCCCVIEYANAGAGI